VALRFIKESLATAAKVANPHQLHMGLSARGSNAPLAAARESSNAWNAAATNQRLREFLK